MKINTDAAARTMALIIGFPGILGVLGSAMGFIDALGPDGEQPAWPYWLTLCASLGLLGVGYIIVQLGEAIIHLKYQSTNQRPH